MTLTESLNIPDPVAELAARAERATAEEQAGVVRGALTLALDRGLIPRSVFSSAMGMWHAGAFLSAALVLVPAGMVWDVDATAPECGIDWNLSPVGAPQIIYTGTAATPALAVVAACCRARMA